MLVPGHWHRFFRLCSLHSWRYSEGMVMVKRSWSWETCSRCPCLKMWVGPGDLRGSFQPQLISESAMEREGHEDNQGSSRFTIAHWQQEVAQHRDKSLKDDCKDQRAGSCTAEWKLLCNSTAWLASSIFMSLLSQYSYFLKIQ